MEAQKLTPWFPGHINPAREGVYMRRWPDEGKWYAWWNGRHWLPSYSTPEVAAKWTSSGSLGERGLAWRGLASKP